MTNYTKHIILTISTLLFCSCASKSYLAKHNLPKNITSLNIQSYNIIGENEVLGLNEEYVFTKNGRIKTGTILSPNRTPIEYHEKKLWFTKRSFPSTKPAQYCKTRWKFGNRERISCYTQKQYKENEIIIQYNDNQTIDKIVDNFTTFYTQKYYYTNNELSRIVITDKSGNLIDTILIECLEKDNQGLCTKQQLSNLKGDTTIKELIATYKD